jgi:hypothetical protein
MPIEMVIDLAWLRGMRDFQRGNYCNPFLGDVDTFWSEYFGIIYQLQQAWQDGQNFAASLAR